MATAIELKDRLHALDTVESPETWHLRLHRAISWLARSEREDDDLDAQFVFQWMALNAAYARELTHGESERSRFNAFIRTLVALDEAGALHQALFERFTGPIRTLIDNKFIFEPFWKALREHDASNQWEASFTASKRLATTATLDGDTATLLSVVFDRLYVLRNQLVHGGATWNSQVNRQQVRDGTAILGTIVPMVLELILQHPEQDFGEVMYPVV